MDHDKARVIEALRAAILANPELRVGQLVENARLCYKDRAAADLFYLPDHDLIHALYQYCKGA